MVATSSKAHDVQIYNQINKSDAKKAKQRKNAEDSIIRSAKNNDNKMKSDVFFIFLKKAEA